MAQNAACEKTFGAVMQAARWEIDISFQALSELLGWTPETEDAPPTKGLQGGSRAQLERYENRKALPDWNLAKHIIFHLQCSPAQVECMIWGYVRDILKERGIVNVTDEAAAPLVDYLRKDYAEFIEKELWRLH